jgi:RHS repeat-associated protein
LTLEIAFNSATGSMPICLGHFARRPQPVHRRRCRHPTWHGNGNLTFDGSYTLEHDAENRLVSATDGSTGAAYAFDGRGRRKLKAVGETSVTISVTDADNREVLEYDGLTGAVLRWYAYGLGPNAVVSQINVGTNTRNTPIPNLLGSVVGSYDSTGALTKYGYQPYGSGSPAPQFAYTGQRIDPETGGLYYYRARHYSTAWGRFLQPDPAGYRGGRHLYGYVSNDPLNFVDPSGMYVEVAVNGNDVRLTLPIRFAGDAATPERIAGYTREIQNVWSGSFGKYNVVTSVIVPAENAARSQMNTIVIQMGPVGPRGDLPAVTNLVGGNRSTFSQPAMGPGAAAHEAGHLMGLRDQYTDSYVGGARITTPNPGYAGNIMGENSGRPSESDITAIIYRFGPSPQPPSSASGMYPAPSSHTPAPSSFGWSGGK